MVNVKLSSLAAGARPVSGEKMEVVTFEMLCKSEKYGAFEWYC